MINEFRREKLYSQVGLSAISFDPLSDRLSKHIAEFIEANSRAFKRFRAKEIEESVALKRYCLRHQGGFRGRGRRKQKFLLERGFTIFPILWQGCYNAL